MDDQWLAAQLHEASRELNKLQRMLEDMMEAERDANKGNAGAAGRAYEKLNAVRVPLFFIEDRLKK